MPILCISPLWCCKMGVLRLFIRKRKHGSRIDSIPLNQLVKLSACRERSWVIEDNPEGKWLILEGR